MRVFRTSYRDKNGKRRTAKRWYVEIRDTHGAIRRLAGLTDKRATEELGRKVERLVSLRIAGETPEAPTIRWLEGLPTKIRERLAALGLLDKTSVAASRPLTAHVADYKQALLDKGNTVKHAAMVDQRVRSILDGTSAVFFSDLSAAAVQRFLADRREKGLSVASSNRYLSAVKSFTRWLVGERRVSECPLAHIRKLNEQTDRRHVRRAFESEELRLLLDTTYHGPIRFGMSGRERYWAYRIAAETGLRAAELRSLRVGSFDLSGSPPTVTVEAGYSKHRRQDVQPLRADTAAELRGILSCKLPDTPVFGVPEKTAKMLRADLEASGIPYRDDRGQVLDFHSFRHTFITNLAAAGVHPKRAMDLARHSDINLTLARYTHTSHGELAAALEGLPDLSVSEVNAKRATGTDDADGRLAHCLARSCTERGNSVHRDARKERVSRVCDGRSDRQKHPEKQGFLPEDGGNDEPRRSGLEPLTFGSVDRCSVQLS